MTVGPAQEVGGYGFGTGTYGLEQLQGPATTTLATACSRCCSHNRLLLPTQLLFQLQEKLE